MATSIDDTDRRILDLLQGNGRISNADIAREVGMAPSATLERVRKLEERGVIRAYETRLDPEAIGQSLAAFVFVRSTETPRDAYTSRALAELPEVQEVHHVAGEDCFLVKVRVRDPRDLQRVLRESIGTIPSVVSTRSTVVLESVKETSSLRLPETGTG